MTAPPNARAGGDIVERLNEACVGHPHARIPWPHRLLHDAAAEIERLRAALRGVAGNLRACGGALEAEPGAAVWMWADNAEAAAATDLPHPAGWQPIETAPRDGTAFRGWGRDGIYVAALWDIDTNDRPVWLSSGRAVDPTHWCALPAPPEVTP